MNMPPKGTGNLPERNNSENNGKKKGAESPEKRSDEENNIKERERT